MKAEIARNYTELANSLESRMSKIFGTIRKSADSGLDFVILDSIDEECIERLIHLGYRIFINENENHFTIEW
jgi:hypothetical protein